MKLNINFFWVALASLALTNAQETGPVEIVTASCTTFYFSGATSTSTHTFTYTSYPSGITVTTPPVMTITKVACPTVATRN